MRHIQVSRYGKFIPKKQENNYGNDTYHSAPAPFGFYCFDIRHIERFLVGHVYKKQVKNKLVYTTNNYKLSKE